MTIQNRFSQETSFSSSQPVTRSLSSVGRKQPTSTSRLPVLGQWEFVIIICKTFYPGDQCPLFFLFLKYFKIASPPHLSPALILEREANLSLTISFDEANRSLIRLSRFNSMNNKNLMDNKTKFFARNNKDSNLHVFAATSLSKSNSVNNKNSLNNKMNNNGEKQLLTNGNNSNLINNNETIKNTNNSKVRFYTNTNTNRTLTWSTTTKQSKT